MDKKPFKILEVKTGSCFDATVEVGKRPTEYSLQVEIAPDAPGGPCAELLEIRTDSVVQPLIRVPVFANIARRLQADPPMVVLRRSGVSGEDVARVTLRTPGLTGFSIAGLASDQDFVDVVETQPEIRRDGVRLLRVTLNDRVQPGTHQATITVRSSVSGAEKIEIPVTVIVSPTAGAD